MKLIFAAAAALLIAFGAPAYGVVNPEVEPNNVKATATLCNSGGVGMDAGDTITGATTGTSGMRLHGGNQTGAQSGGNRALNERHEQSTGELKSTNMVCKKCFHMLWRNLF